MAPWAISDVDRHHANLSPAKKARWVAVANSALAKCIADGGTDETCAPSAIRQANGVVNHEEMQMYAIQADHLGTRTEMHQDRAHIVVPVIMMREGVHHGSHGPRLHTADELGRFIQAWNGIPVVIHHPKRDGEDVSANSPDVIDSQTVGRIYNAHMDGPKLCAEAWIDVAKINAISPEAMALIQAERPLDVSVGVFSEDEDVEGNWNGENYVGIARGYRPDHLALLPGGRGACSWDDGCGIRANSEKGGETDLADEKTTITPAKTGEITVKLNVDTTEVDKVIEKYDTIAKGYASKGYFLVQADQGFREIMNSIQQKLDHMDDDVKVHFLQDVFDNYFIYEVRGRMSTQYTGSGLYKRSYTVATSGAVEFTGESKAVRREVSYVENSAKGEIKSMAEEKKKPCCPGKVKLLIESEHAPFQETDRPWLETLEEVQINKLVDMNNLLVKEPDEKPAPITNEQAIQVLREQLRTPEQFIALLPEGMRDSMTSGYQMHEQKRAEMVSIIKANSRYTDEQLKTKSMSEIEILADALKPKDYSVLGAGKSIEDNEMPDMLLPVGVEDVEGGKK